jgi:hypothetical protein
MRIPARPRPGSAPVRAAGSSPEQRPAPDGTTRMAGWSGIVFSGLLVAGLVLVNRIPKLGDSDAAYKAFYGGGDVDTLTVLGLYIVPFAGIACLWHMIATRTLLQVRRPLSWTEVPHWLHLAASVIFVCLLFAGTAAVGAVALLTQFSSAPLPGPDVARALSSLGYALVFVYGVRAAGMYMFTTTGLMRSAGLLPRPLVLLSYLVATGLLLSTTFHPAILLVFPAWVLMVSIVLLVHRPPPTGADHDRDAQPG